MEYTSHPVGSDGFSRVTTTVGESNAAAFVESSGLDTEPAAAPTTVQPTALHAARMSNRASTGVRRARAGLLTSDLKGATGFNRPWWELSAS
jgi:hypothetical protein